MFVFRDGVFWRELPLLRQGGILLHSVINQGAYGVKVLSTPRGHAANLPAQQGLIMTIYCFWCLSDACVLPLYIGCFAHEEHESIWYIQLRTNVLFIFHVSSCFRVGWVCLCDRLSVISASIY